MWWEVVFSIRISQARVSFRTFQVFKIGILEILISVCSIMRNLRTKLRRWDTKCWTILGWFHATPISCCALIPAGPWALLCMLGIHIVVKEAGSLFILKKFRKDRGMDTKCQVCNIHCKSCNVSVSLGPPASILAFRHSTCAGAWNWLRLGVRFFSSERLLCTVRYSTNKWLEKWNEKVDIQNTSLSVIIRIKRYNVKLQ